MTPTPTPSPSLGAYSLPIPSDTSFAFSSGLKQTVPALMNQLLPTLTLIAGALALFYILYAGILYITAGGNEAQVKAARGTLMGVVIGIIVIVATFSIIRFAVSAGTSVNQLLPQ